MQDLCIIGLENLFFLNTLLGVLRQGISSSISFVLSIIDPKVVPWQLLSLTDLPRAQAFHIYEALEVVMVCKYENFMLAAFQVVPPGLKRCNNGQQLSVVVLIPSFSRNHLLKEIGYQMSLAWIIRGQLTENPTNSLARYIHFILDMTLQIKII